MYRKLGFALIVVITLLFGVLTPAGDRFAPSAVHAQSGGAPLVFLKDGDLWKWDGSAVTQITAWGYNERPVLSPDGKRIAYNSWATILVDQIAAGQPFTGLVPSNIWLMDPITLNANRLVDQPPDAVLGQDLNTSKVIMRGTPAWSPDGTQLVWAELVTPGWQYQLVVYNLTTAAQSVIVASLPAPFSDGGFVVVHDVLWGGRGILVRNVAVNDALAEFEERAYLYAPDGTFIHDTLIGSSATEWAASVEWTQYNGQQYLGLVFLSGRRYLVDPATGDQQDMPALPELYSTQAMNNTASAFIGTNIDAAGNITHPWNAVYPNRQQEQALNFSGDLPTIAVSADGQALAYISDAVYVWQNGSLVTLPGTEGIGGAWDLGIVWGPNAWRVRTDFPGQAAQVPSVPQATPITGGVGGGASFAIACTLPPRLIVGQTGQVTPGLPNAVRTLPRRGSDSVVVGQIPGGGVFNVLGEPQCDNEGRYWWQVNYNGLQGWTPEGEWGIYWLQPYSGSPVPIACALPPRLTPGAAAYVTPGLPNLLRSLPRRGSDSLILGRIPGNGVFTVLGGPQCDNEGRYWWQVNYAGIVGWTAEGENGVYWLAPFGCPKSPLPRLGPGMQAKVTPGLPNRLRAGPGTNYTTISQIPAGGVFTVLSGPQCGPEGWSYWRVQYGTTIGWTAEGDGSTYWLEPVSWTPQPLSIPTPTPIPAICAPPPILRPSVSAYVIPGPSNTLRSAPGTASNSGIIGQIPGSAFFYVLGGPQCGNDGRYWWQVKYGGTVGWTAEGEGTAYWVSLFMCPGGLPTRLVPGGYGRVVPGLPNAIRSLPGTYSGSVVIGEIPGGASFTVIGGPQCGNDNRMWWQINYNGIIGWTAEGEGGTYWLEPIIT
jgi:hypothetical protein